VLNEVYQEITGEASPVQGGGHVAPELDRIARQAVSKLAGHARLRAAGAYIGSVQKPARPSTGPSARALPANPSEDDSESTPA